MVFLKIFVFLYREHFWSSFTFEIVRHCKSITKRFGHCFVFPPNATMCSALKLENTAVSIFHDILGNTKWSLLWTRTEGHWNSMCRKSQCSHWGFREMQKNLTFLLTILSGKQFPNNIRRYMDSLTYFFVETHCSWVFPVLTWIQYHRT